MASELVDFGKRVSKIVDPAVVKRIVMAGGLAGKEAALDAASKDLGGDRAFSGLRRKVSLGAGFDDVGNSQIRINFRPAGLWKLAESGRRAGKPIYPRGGSRRGKGVIYGRAVSTPQGPRARSTTGAWGGKGTFTDAVRDARVKVPRAAFKQFQAEVRRVVK